MSPPDGAGSAAAPLTLREAQLAEILDLRARVLRSHLPEAPATAPCDDVPSTWHLGAFRGDRLVGTVTVFPEEAPGHPGVPAHRFRFMAVEPDEQGGGAGTALMGEVAARARAAGSRLLWAKGRDTALAFYTRLGFAVVGDGFDDATSHLPHHIVIRDL